MIIYESQRCMLARVAFWIWSVNKLEVYKVPNRITVDGFQRRNAVSADDKAMHCNDQEDAETAEQ